MDMEEDSSGLQIERIHDELTIRWRRDKRDRDKRATEERFAK
jgi:hypothetical protein